MLNYYHRGWFISSFFWPPNGFGSGVTSLNGETGAITLVAGSGITISPVGQNITIAATSTGTVSSVSVVTANGFAGNVTNPTTTPAITLSTTITGILQGNGTAISAATIGNLTDVGTDGITITSGTNAVLGSGTSIAQQVSDTTHNGYLSSTDWNRFNSITQTVPARTFYIDGSRSDTYTESGTCNYPFKDPQTAINQIITNADNDSTHPYNLIVLNQPSGGFGTLNMSSAALVYVNIYGLGGSDQSAINFLAINCTGTNFFLGGFAFLNVGTFTITPSAANTISIRDCKIGTIASGGVTQLLMYNTQVGIGNFTNAPFVFYQGSQGFTGKLTLVNSAMVMQGCSSLSTGVAIDVDSTSLFFTRNGVRIASGTITLNGTMQAYGSWIGTTITIGAVGSLLNRGSFIDPANVVNVSGGTYTQQTTCQMIGYTPTTSGNWNTIPTQVRGALDTLATSGIVKSQTQNLVLASPNGSSGLPSFRALVAADIPSLSGTYLPLAGGTMSGIINMGSNKITSVTDPTAAQDAATKAYVDNIAAGINPAIAVEAASTSSSDLSGYTYNNGVGGIGATLTAGAINTALTVDGYTFTALGQRLLEKDNSTAAYNGVYYVTQIQTALLPIILTRALDYDMPSDINDTGSIPVVNGTVNTLTSWLLTSQVTTVGTDPLTYTQFTRNPNNYLLKANNLSDVTSASTSFNNISPMTTLGDVIYGGASGAGTRLAGNITSTLKFLTQTGTGAVSAAPVWNILSSSNLPTITLTGDVTGAASGGSIATTIANLAVTNAKIANSTIDLTAKVTGALPIANGGTGQTTANPAFNALSPLTTKGDLISYSTVNARLPVGSNGQVLTADSTQTLGVKWAASSGSSETVVIRDQKTAGTAGGTFTSGAWRTRDLNQLNNPQSVSWVSISSNQITLSNGTYAINASCPVFGINYNQAKLYNITDSVDEIIGQNAFSAAGNNGSTPAVVMGMLVVSGGPKVYELQHQCNTTGTTTGFGLSINGQFTVAFEIYSVIQIQKVA